MSGTPSHWHASAIELPIGTVLSPRPDFEMRWQCYSAGRILEDMRPETSLAHRDAVFLCDNAQDTDNCGAHTEWLFGVIIEGAAERHDLTWASEIERLVSDGSPPDCREVRILARRYWSGEASEDPVWEHLVPRAVIVSVEPW